LQRVYDKRSADEPPLYPRDVFPSTSSLLHMNYSFIHYVFTLCVFNTAMLYK